MDQDLNIFIPQHSFTIMHLKNSGGFQSGYPPHSFPAAQCLVMHFIWISMINRPQRLQALIKELLLEEAKRTTRIIRNKCCKSKMEYLDDHPSGCKRLMTMVISFPSQGMGSSGSSSTCFCKRGWLCPPCSSSVCPVPPQVAPAKKGKCAGMFSGI